MSSLDLGDVNLQLLYEGERSIRWAIESIMVNYWGSNTAGESNLRGKNCSKHSEESNRPHWFDTSSYTVRPFLGQVRYFSVEGYTDGKNDHRLGNYWRHSLVAGKMALDNANLSQQVVETMLKMRIGLLVGYGMGGLNVFSDGMEALVQRGYKKMSLYFIPY
ncbi:3-oxoacyl-[acyl-carrier-protein] synthase I, chloroplastic [Capsicum baccatum]|uniref:beta-ketoacyl-[acyl-carrier-protein] synthase I n=1 Tax=Capsicum baccatum TaxID=33114 RepID=A0A2G2XQF1_CAPBA|nr:3-oxoacyl-[acyl-carrier-protein] synthase I, chloroplastic [Capsicum baccatum]